MRSYEAAYREIAKAAHAPGSAGLQRFFEIAAVAEIMHLKVCCTAVTICAMQKR